MLFSVFSFTAYAGTPASTEGTGLIIVKVSGELTAPGNVATYMITKTDNKPITDFSNYELIPETKIPLEISTVKTNATGSTFTVSLLDTCAISDVPYSGKVTIKNKDNTETVSLSFNGTAKNIINPVSGNISITANKGSKVYDFANTSGTTTIVFGESAEAKLSGTESGTKCLSYNLDPNSSIKTKYKLTDKSAFINFIGAPQFANKVTLTFMIPIETSMPVLYQLKEGTTDELEEVLGYKISKSSTGNIITFDTMSLQKTYVIVPGKLEGVKQAAVTDLNVGANTDTNTKTTTDKSQPSPKTGSTMFTYSILSALSLAFLVLAINKKRKG